MEFVDYPCIRTDVCDILWIEVRLGALYEKETKAIEKANGVIKTNRRTKWTDLS